MVCRELEYILERHSYATFLIRKTKDIFYVQKQLGHHSILVTVDRYGHLLEEDTKIRLVDVLDDAATN
jgi:integrase